MVYGPSNPLPKTIEPTSKHPAIIEAVVSVCVHVRMCEHMSQMFELPSNTIVKNGSRESLVYKIFK